MPRQFECQLCGWKGHPSFELTSAGKLAAQCGGKECSYVDAALTPADFNEGIAVDKGGANPVRVETKGTVSSPARQPHIPGAIPKTVADRFIAPGAGPIDPIALIEARRAFLEGEVARLDAAKLELKKLNRMLGVARREQARAEIAREVDAALTAQEPN
jgi:hypothetical protein